MKNRFLITLLILSVMSPAFADKVIKSAVYDSEMDLQKTFYESPLSQIPNMEVDKVDTIPPQGYYPAGRRPPYSDRSMPLFKQVRIKITNYFRQKDIDNAQKYQSKKIEDMDEFDELDNEQEITLYSSSKETPTNETQSQEVTNTELSEETVVNTELVGGVKEQVVTKEAILDAETVDFNNETMDITAIGNPILNFPNQNITLKADKIIYNNVSNILKAYDNVEILRDGSTIYGDYIQINLNEENSLINNVITSGESFEIRAKNATSDEKSIVLNEGNMQSQGNYIFRLKTAMVGGFDYSRMLISDEDKSFLTELTGERSNITVKVDELEVDAKKAHNVITAKEIEIYNGKKHLLDWSLFQAHTNKEQDYFEGNYPEVGSKNPMGFWVGAGPVFDIPNGATLKVMPLLNYKNKIGLGGALKYRSATNQTHFMYGSAKDVFVLKGKQYLDDKLYLQYGMNAFLDEWFLGARMPKYSIEAVYADGAVIPNTMGEGLHLQFKNRISAGYIGDAKYTLRDENIAEGKDATSRFRYMAEIVQSLYRYEDKERLRLFDFGVVMQGSAAVYGTGDTQFIGRIGPRIHTQYKYWMQDVGYFASGYHDETPLRRYDTYRYGHANVYLREAIRLNKYLAVAWSCSANLLKEAPNGKLLQENGFLVSLGPDDLKINLGYDFVREATFFNITMAMNVKDSTLEYKKMVIKNPDRLSSSKTYVKELPKQTDFVTATNAKILNPKMQYAEVIEIQDPDKEQVQ